MSHAPYVGSDFEPPLSADAELMLEFVEEKSRVIRELKGMVWVSFGAGLMVGYLLTAIR